MNLADELVRVLTEEEKYPPKAPDELALDLFRGRGIDAGIPEIVAALDELVQTGKVERRHSPRLGVRYRITRRQAS